MSSGCDLDVQIGFSSSFCPENKSKQPRLGLNPGHEVAQIDRGAGDTGDEIVGKLEQFAKMSQVPPIILPISTENYSSETGSGS